MKNKSGYRPWVARKAPLFNTSLNETYIKVSALFPIIAVSLIIGASVALASKKSIPSFEFIALNKQVQAPTVKAEVNKPVQAVAVSVEPVKTPDNTSVQESDSAPNLANTNTVMVPEIPMHNSTNPNFQPSNVIK